jgi:hypothetical protein
VNWAFQRDAVVTALEIAGIPKTDLRIAPQISDDLDAGTTSIFDSEDDVTTVEDLVILQDLDNVDEDWNLLKRQRYPAKTFQNGDTKLTVILANKLELEKQLGTDLIYVNETLKSVVFVQYKMFKGRDGEEGYRPDAQLEEEIKRMDAAAKTLSAIPEDQSCDGYRMAKDPFFLKFCSKLLTHESDGHVPGVYVPLSYWKLVANTPAIEGPKGGKVVKADSFGRRHLTPTNFIDMVGRGWIGTSALQAKVLVPYLKGAMAGKKGVVLAVQSDIDWADAGKDDEAEADRALVGKFTPPKPRHPGKKKPVIQL